MSFGEWLREATTSQHRFQAHGGFGDVQRDRCFDGRTIGCKEGDPIGPVSPERPDYRPVIE